LEQSDDWETSADILYDSLESSGFDTDDLKDYGELATDIAESVLEAYGVDTDALKEGASASYADWDELDD
jgi:hypothetical protein